VKAVEGPVMIVAGAGSGKTRALTYRVAHLVSLGVRPYEILALTFTNKAANEMKSRIIDLVGLKSREVWMGTFHSIFARILRVEAEKIGYGKNFTIYDSDDSLSVGNELSGPFSTTVQSARDPEPNQSLKEPYDESQRVREDCF
jgi:DNA helicase-2/ATP-dependent DNA helicase PcrA